MHFKNTSLELCRTSPLPEIMMGFWTKNHLSLQSLIRGEPEACLCERLPQNLNEGWQEEKREERTEEGQFVC